MALHLITGYAGQEHITSADQGAYNMATYGSGNFVLDRGRKFAQTVLSNNSISIADGEAMMQGRYIKMPSGTTEEVTIENGTQGNNRNDLICIRYEKSSVDATESTSLVVIKGTETTGTAVDPTYNNGNITDGDDTIADFPLYRVKLNGINIQTVQALFEVKISMVDYMDNYQLPIANGSRLGGVKIGNGFTMTADGKISTAIAGANVGRVSRSVYFLNGVPHETRDWSVNSYRERVNFPNDVTIPPQSSVTVSLLSIKNTTEREYVDVFLRDVRASSNGCIPTLVMSDRNSEGVQFTVRLFNITNEAIIASSIEVQGLYK